MEPKVLYLYRLIGSLPIIIWCIKVSFMEMTKKLPADADWMIKDTKKKAGMCFFMLITMFPGGLLGMLLSIDEFYFGPEFVPTIIGFICCCVFIIMDIIFKKKDIHNTITTIVGIMNWLCPIILLIVVMSIKHH